MLEKMFIRNLLNSKMKLVRKQGYSSKGREDVGTWIQDTKKALESPASLGHLLIGEAPAFTAVCTLGRKAKPLASA